MSLQLTVQTRASLVPPKRFLAAMLWAIAGTASTPVWAEEVERTMALVELRTGEDANPQTADYLQEVASGVQKEAVQDVMLVAMAKSAERLRRDRDQVPSALTDERRKGLEALRKQGINFLDNVDAVEAIKALRAAEAKYRAALAAPGADEKLRKDYLDVLAQLATAHVVAKDRDSAAEVFRTVVTAFGPKASVTDDNYRPDVVEVFKRVVKELTTQPKGSVEVTSEPGGAHVLINGIDRGVTPVTVGDLVPGVYTIRLQAGAASSTLHRVKVTAGGKARLGVDIEYERHLVLEDARVGLGYADLETANRRVLTDSVTLGKELGVASVAAVGVLDGTLYAWLVDVAQARIERSSSVKVPGIGTSPRAVAKVLGTLLGDRGRKEEGAPSAGAPDKPGAWYTSVPGIICGVAALASLGVGAAYAPNLTVTEVHTQEEKDAATTGRTIAGVGLGAGAVLAGASAFFFWRQGQAASTTQAWSLPPPQLGVAAVRFATHGAPLLGAAADARFAD